MLAEQPAVADRGQLDLTPGRQVRSRVAGIFLFLPLLARLRFDQLIVQAGYPGSRMVPASGAETLAVRCVRRLKATDAPRAAARSPVKMQPPKATYGPRYTLRRSEGRPGSP